MSLHQFSQCPKQQIMNIATAVLNFIIRLVSNMNCSVKYADAMNDNKATGPLMETTTEADIHNDILNDCVKFNVPIDT